MEESQDSADLWHYERAVRAQGYRVVAGVDESGRGPLAGPVVAAAVILPFECDIGGIYDSKQLSPANREAAYDKILSIALGVGVGIVDADEIDRLNILQATYQAMRIAIGKLTTAADIFLVDGYPIRNFEFPQVGIIDGDCKSASIAAASIIAKVTRDRIMLNYDRLYPQYGFAKHKGYPTEEHLRNLAIYGPCDIHRKTFGPVAEELNLLWARQDLLSAEQAKKEL
ncbi:MAG: ribonuclease HII [Armatimonadota bacterium]|nr:ribonuclease HII [Armatimonadota bacterium]